jgi:cell division protein FtsB
VKEFWGEFFKLLKDLLPALSAFFFGKSIGERKVDDIRQKRDALKLEVERLKNSEKVEEQNRGKSYSDIIDDAISRGKRK